MVRGTKKRRNRRLANSEQAPKTRIVPEHQVVGKSRSFHGAKMVLGLVALVLVSGVAFYKACGSRSPINSRDDALVATAIKPGDNATVASTPTASENSNTLASSTPDSFPNTETEKHALARSREQTQALARARDKSLSYEDRSYPVERRMANRNIENWQAQMPSSKAVVVEYPSVHAKTLAELVQDSNFAIKIHADKRMIIGNVPLEKGEYVGKLKNIGENWYLEIFTVNGKSPVGTLTLERLKVNEDGNPLTVTVFESAKAGIIRIHLRDDLLIGFFETGEQPQ